MHAEKELASSSAILRDFYLDASVWCNKTKSAKRMTCMVKRKGDVVGRMGSGLIWIREV